MADLWEFYRGLGMIVGCAIIGFVVVIFAVLFIRQVFAWISHASWSAWYSIEERRKEKAEARLRALTGGV